MVSKGVANRFHLLYFADSLGMRHGNTEPAPAGAERKIVCATSDATDFFG
jgi:hypothetical protein